MQGEALAHGERERAALQVVLDAAGLQPDAPLLEELRQVNAALWRIEDEIRDHESRADFGARFIALARSIYRTNDRRAALKRALNERHGSALVEETSYRPD